MKKIITLLVSIIITSNLLFASAANTMAVDTIYNKENVSDSVAEMGIVARIGSWYTNNLNYINVSLLMALESSFIPFPSEIVVPPAAYAACNPQSPLYTTPSPLLNVILVVLFATIGALIGALINYAISYILGRPFVYWFANSKVGHLCLINEEKVKKAEDYFVEHGNISTFVGRLIPVIRQLISIPAGLAKMNILPFIGYTTLGAAAWNIILAVLGYIAHGQQALIQKYNNELSWIVLAIVIIVAVIFMVKTLCKRKKQNP